MQVGQSHLLSKKDAKSLVMALSRGGYPHAQKQVPLLDGRVLYEVTRVAPSPKEIQEKREAATKPVFYLAVSREKTTATISDMVLCKSLRDVVTQHDWKNMRVFGAVPISSEVVKKLLEDDNAPNR